MSMSKKDFVALADALRVPCMAGEAVDRSLLLASLIAFCKSQNDQFKADRWIGYLRGDCGPSGGKR